MAQPIYCDAGCGQLYVVRCGMDGQVVENFWCAQHFCEFALQLMDTWEKMALTTEGALPGSEEEGRPIIEGRRSRRRSRPRVMAVDGEGDPVVEDQAPEDAAPSADAG
jgi:hypothetical protein